MFEALQDWFGASALNCLYGGALGFGLFYALLLLFFQGIGDVFGDASDLFSGLGGADAGIDVDMDVDVDGDVDNGLSISMMAIAFFISAFGAFGILGTSLGLNVLSLFLALGGGMVFGVLGQAFFVYVLSPTTNSMVNQSALVGTLAEVTTPIPQDGIGQIALVAGGGRMTLSARSVGGESIVRGTEVRVEKIVGSVALVTAADEYEI